jgi:hypothetical protein
MAARLLAFWAAPGRPRQGPPRTGSRSRHGPSLMAALCAKLCALLVMVVGGGGFWHNDAPCFAARALIGRRISVSAWAARRAALPLRLRGGVDRAAVDFYPFSEEPISVSGSDSGRYWEDNFELPPALKGVRLPGPRDIRDIRNISDVLGAVEPRVSGQKVCCVRAVRTCVHARECLSVHVCGCA